MSVRSGWQVAVILVEAGSEQAFEEAQHERQFQHGDSGHDNSHRQCAGYRQCPQHRNSRLEGRVPDPRETHKQITDNTDGHDVGHNPQHGRAGGLHVVDEEVDGDVLVIGYGCSKSECEGASKQDAGNVVGGRH
ncbi:MAG: hypothetical protein ABJO05_16175 [Roseibium sp.]